MRRARVLFALGALFALFALGALAAGCGEDKPWEPPPQASTAKPAEPAKPEGTQGTQGAAAAAPAAGSSPTPNLPDLPERQFSEADFSETDRNRDPFRSFAGLFAEQAKGRTVLQRQVLVDRYSLDELKLIGVVTRAPPRALFTDPSGLGWVLKVGDYVGKPEIVHTGGPTGADVAINWRVDRIRESDVVFVREDPAHPEIAPVTRVVALFPPDDQESARGGR
jgi:type IV pilus assembly protein PilP